MNVKVNPAMLSGPTAESLNACCLMLKFCMYLSNILTPEHNGWAKGILKWKSFKKRTQHNFNEAKRLRLKVTELADVRKNSPRTRVETPK